jgi:hypothetical protein
VDLIPGAPLLIPVRVEGALPGSFEPTIVLSDGRELGASLVWIGVQIDPASSGGWVPSVDRWVVAHASEGAIPASAGSWHVLGRVPADAAGQAVRLGERSLRASWLVSPEALRPGGVPGGEVWEPWRRPAGSAMPSSDLLAPEWRSPLRRWRARLVTTGLDAPAPIEGIWPVLGPRAPLDAMADLIEARWRVGLARLWYADGSGCARLLARLSRTVALAPGIDAPAWPAEQASLDLLLADLLDPGLSGAPLVARSDAWMRSLPEAAAWIDDDAASIHGETGSPIASIRTAALGPSPSMLWIEGQRGLRVGDPQPLEPGAVVDVRTEVRRGSPHAGDRAFQVHAGDEVVEVVARDAEEIRPPGARCGPLLHDWTLAAWTASEPGRGGAAAQAWGAAAMLYRDDSGASDSGWSIYIECAREIDEGSDTVRIWFGPRGAATATLRAASDGTVRDERAGGEEILLGVSQARGKWSMSVPVPRAALEPGGVVRLGLTREDARGVRTAWPRRLMPWEDEPSRAAIDVRAWSGLEPQ